VLKELGIELSCIFVVRNPLDVANSLKNRDLIPLHQGFGIWFNQNLVALKDAAGLPTAFLAYDQFLESWERELRRCAVALALEWPADDQPLKQVMSSFIRPELRHSKSSAEKLQGASRPIQTLFAALSEAIAHPTASEDRLRDTVTALLRDFYDYASFFQSGLDRSFAAQVTHRRRYVAFVLSVCNQLDATVRCLESLAHIGVSDSEIVVVDNASTDGTREFLAGRPSLCVLSNRAGLGRSAGWNQGIQAAGATWTVILTPEAIPTPGFREGLIHFAEEEGCDLASPAVGEGDLDYELSAFAEKFVKTMGRACRHGMAWSGLFIVHRRVFDRVGLFDPGMQPAGAEVEDFFRRACAVGFRLAVTGRAYMHYCGAMPPIRLTGRVKKPNGDHRESQKTRRMAWCSEYLRGKMQALLWRFNEQRHFGMTLRMKRSRGRWRFA
jgi:GT2 family glycosyltransferase